MPPGLWLGVEWDHPSRGKHDGSHDGVQYFTCRYVIHVVMEEQNLQPCSLRKFVLGLITLAVPFTWQPRPRCRVCHRFRHQHGSSFVRPAKVSVGVDYVTAVRQEYKTNPNPDFPSEANSTIEWRIKERR